MALAANALTTLLVAKDELGIRPSDASEDEAIERRIDVASQLVAKHVGRALHYGAGIVEKVAGFGGQRLFLSRTPVLSVASVTLDGEEVSSDSFSIEEAGTGILYREAGWRWTATLAPGLVGPVGMAGREALLYSVTYTGGWVTRPQVAGVLTLTLPADIEQACLFTVVQLWRMRGRYRNLDVETKESEPDDWGGLGIPEIAQSLLAPYVRHP